MRIIEYNGIDIKLVTIHSLSQVGISKHTPDKFSFNIICDQPVESIAYDTKEEAETARQDFRVIWENALNDD
jgi:hypothetical protein